MTARFRIGISGWRYPPWRGSFYPEKLPQKEELRYASGLFSTIELNGSFYSLQHPASYSAWHASTPPGFVFAVKGGRFITHMKKLNDIEKPLANFFASGLLNLREKLGPILWQFPPNMRFDAAKFGRFFDLLPRTTKEASALARRHDAKVTGRAALKAPTDMPVRHAVEIRHDSFSNPEFIRLLAAHNIALVIADTAGRWPLIEDVTADFLYLRMHGDKEIYVSGYGSDALASWAERIRTWERGGEPPDARKAFPARVPKKRMRDVYVYFDNDVKVRAPFDAMKLARILGARIKSPLRTVSRQGEGRRADLAASTHPEVR